MKRIFCLFLFVLLAASSAHAGDDEIHTGRQLGHPEFLQCSTDEDCTIITTSTCSLQMSVNANYAAQADAAAAQKLKCTGNIPPFNNARPICSIHECSMIVSKLGR